MAFPGPQIVKLSFLRGLFRFLAHLEYFVKGGVEGVLLHFGLPLAALRLVGQQVHFDVAGKRGSGEIELSIAKKGLHENSFSFSFILSPAYSNSGTLIITFEYLMTAVTLLAVKII